MERGALRLLSQNGMPPSNLVSQASRIFPSVRMRAVIRGREASLPPPTNYRAHAYTGENTAGLRDYILQTIRLPEPVWCE